MSVADKDGRMLQSLMDRHACLGISMNESLLEATAEVERLLSEIEPD